MIECSVCGKCGDARTMLSCGMCGAPLCGDCARRGGGMCDRCDEDDREDHRQE